MPCWPPRLGPGSGEVNLIGLKPAVAAEFRCIAVEDEPVLPGQQINRMRSEGSMGMKTEEEDQPCPLETEKQIFLVFQDQLRSRGIKQAMLGSKAHHGLVELRKEAVTKVSVVPEVPLAACIMVRPVVPFTGEIDPFGVTEFVAHEVQVAIACGG